MNIDAFLFSFLNQYNQRLSMTQVVKLLKPIAIDNQIINLDYRSHCSEILNSVVTIFFLPERQVLL